MVIMMWYKCSINSNISQLHYQMLENFLWRDVSMCLRDWLNHWARLLFVMMAKEWEEWEYREIQMDWIGIPPSSIQPKLEFVVDSASAERENIKCPLWYHVRYVARVVCLYCMMMVGRDMVWKKKYIVYNREENNTKSPKSIKFFFLNKSNELFALKLTDCVCIILI